MITNETFPHRILVDEIDMISNRKPYRIIAKDVIGNHTIMTKYLKTHACFVSTVFNHDPREIYDVQDVKITKNRVDAEWNHLEFVARIVELEKFSRNIDQ